MFNKRRVAPAAGTAQLIGRPKVPLPGSIVRSIADACARDDRVLSAYLFWSMLAAAGEAPCHTVGLVLRADISQSEKDDLTAAIYARAEHALGEHALTFQVLDHDSLRAVREAVGEPFFQRSGSAS